MAILDDSEGTRSMKGRYADVPDKAGPSDTKARVSTFPATCTPRRLYSLGIF